MSRRHQPDSQPPRPSASRRLAARVLVFSLLLTLLATALPATAGASTISRRITAILRDNGVATSRTAVSVYDRTAGASLYAWNSATLLAPASNMKLVTSSTARVTWPADPRFPTSLAFTLPLKRASEPFAFESGYALLRVLERKEGTKEEFEKTKATETDQVLGLKKNKFLQSYLAKLRTDRGVKVRYDQFLQLTQDVLSRYDEVK